MQVLGMEVPSKVKLGGFEIDLGPLLAKLTAGDGKGVTLADLVPYVLAYFVFQSQHPANQAPPAPHAPGPPQPPPSKPAEPVAEPLAALKVQKLYIQRNGKNDEGASLDAIGWGNKVRFDANGFDKAGALRADLAHKAIKWYWQWDGGAVAWAQGDLGSESLFGAGLPNGEVRAGSSAYFAAAGAGIELKVDQLKADAARHELKVWAEAESATGLIKSNVLVGHIN